MSVLTGIKDIDLKIISYLNDYDVTRFSQVNKYINHISDNYWKDRAVCIFRKNYTFSQVNIWKGMLSWKNYYRFLIKCGYKSE